MKQTWLVVEDDPLIRAILRAMMTLWDVDPLVLQDGFEAEEWLDRVGRGDGSQLPAIALLDIRMPGPQGHVIARRLRQNPATRDIPIIIMTAYQLGGEEWRYIVEMAHPEQIIMKPFPSPDEFRRLIENTIEAKRQSQLHPLHTENGAARRKKSSPPKVLPQPKQVRIDHLPPAASIGGKAALR